MKHSVKAILPDGLDIGNCLYWCYDYVGEGNYTFGWGPEQDAYIFDFVHEADLTAFVLKFKI